ncbi:MAG TPA: ATP-binding protein [Syntrophobacteraceae bacterium]|nr:ATP-binding protein [Syntrophobacteraceae bacterium]
MTLIFLLTLFFGVLEGWFFKLQPDLPLVGNIFLFALIHLNVILLLLLVYLVLRNLVKLLFERKRNVLGHKLRTRLIVAFVGLAVIPTIPLFWLATQFIFSSLDYWFSQKVEQSLEQAVGLAKEYLDQEGRDLLYDAQVAKGELRGILSEKGSVSSFPGRVPLSLLDFHHLDAMFHFDSAGNLVWTLHRKSVPSDVSDMVQQMSRSDLPKKPQVQRVSLDSRGQRLEGLVALVPDPIGDPDAPGSAELLVCLRFFPDSIAGRLAAITAGYEDYLQLKLLHKPLKTSHFVTFSIVTLLVIFAAIWFAFLLARNITGPIQSLVYATQRIADGDLDVQMDSDRQDEIGMLMSSFDQMVRDLKEGREKLANAYWELKETNQELDGRRRYMEAVLKNIAAGVVGVDAGGTIRAVNKSAEDTFGLKAEEVRGQHYTRFLQPDHMEIIKSFVSSFRLSGQPYQERRVRVVMGNRPMVLFVKVSTLRDEQDEFMGIVIVLDDLTELEKAQRMAAWREVARRIAHEIKNPLTPIRLSAQRLRRKYAEWIEEEGSVLDECTQAIINQVDHLKHLVNEFSTFARLPSVQLVPCDLVPIVEESIALYRNNYTQVTFLLEIATPVPQLQLDPEQFKRVLINLLDNAIHAVKDRAGVISIQLFYDPILKIARLECADNGHGLSAEDKVRMFEPYYSTKEKGTGLGLAIVASIVADHNGYVRVRDNTPEGTVIIIELPG